MRKKKLEQQEAAGVVPAGSPRLTPIDVQQKEFRLAFRGYNERDVDAFLDEITEELASYVEENRRLRDNAAPVVAIPPAGAGPGDDSSSGGAEQILANARVEAARIIREARAEAAAAGATAAPGDHGAVAPFLNKERDFLQSLASLVQGHAENVKEMVKAHRERTAAPAAPVTPSAPIRVPDSVADATEAASDAAATVTRPGSTDAAGDASDTADGAAAPAEAATDRPARSLRELFWGED